MHACLAKILSNREKNTRKADIGSLTTLDRNSWADARAELLVVDGCRNTESLTYVDDALFALCLDPKINDNSIKLKARAVIKFSWECFVVNYFC